ncbi:ribonuclease HI family protein [uncultured Secundilactobacillus sp.]|uniref:ribonuclease HI family protein n=1 Tax=uncultured Secundilactobacillus sp. TaxID=2813935 RepID=UPI002588A395|nr:ribonuclease HI family protein [uncultured Secundilactobacillus sp.]
MYSLYTDAATDSTTLKSAAGILILHNGHQTQLKEPLPDGDNHHSEFKAAIAGFEALQQRVNAPGEATVLYYTDSQLVADSLNKQYAKHYQELVDNILTLQQQFGLVVTNWVPEKQNMGAHTLAFQALHQLY